MINHAMSAGSSVWESSSVLYLLFMLFVCIFYLKTIRSEGNNPYYTLFMDLAAAVSLDDEQN